MSDDWHFRLDYDSYNEIDNGYDKGLGSSGPYTGLKPLESKFYDYRTDDSQVYVNWNNGTNEILPSEIDY